MILEIDAYPLFGTPEVLREYAATLYGPGHHGPGLGHIIAAQLLSDLADQWEARLPKPRMAEPAWGEKIIAESPHLGIRQTWVVLADGTLENREGDPYHWDDLIDPEPYTPEAAAALS